jgi:hypothetical protein
MIALMVLVAVPTTSASAGPLPIGANQAFLGSVNGRFTDGTIDMACYGPVTPGEMGHPMSGQTLEIYSPPPPVYYQPGLKVGNTGDSATKIVASIANDGTVYGRVTFINYFTQISIPTDIELPCGGTGVVRFQPRPVNPNTVHGAVGVTFVGQP